MISANLQRLRKLNQYTQEELAEKLNVSRQAVAKWESGESMPDLNTCSNIARLFNVSLDDLVNYREEDSGVVIPPKGKYLFGSVTVGERGQIVIPKKAREIFHIKAGDQLLILGDEERGIAIVAQTDLQKFFDAIALVPDFPEK
ncbi:helix-turn-helix transcriptional regulator [Ihubacter massiliensis]|uniref:Helix-turn-helix transcriptional regulator n=1 Tax=Hominibacterium faecale TaxID=2839743 RepID=A0A9J6QYN1_9FIRM|nr:MULTISPECIES: helix-turn-helix transcriptional regulator [Eubacteriales Family XIII. Incertae Sedis]MCC2864817.1 helix-turn-helix transcriptional regulator [Anaerovorax odorimutans]MCI7300965.1 helix-turn-helix transcriptional regulator [Clostridia bacterium]MDE8734724.1 helix-turn-helix transcriptional regulator [Eubacteriales bacterium DFI.9.88]MDY3013462.1 helix-turn-helix transcriptional regulator [Clostridiales Family XIII bacterium]MCO7120497.1 helix-turn-helix transcriptional regulat